MILTIKIDTSNAAFDEGPEIETARLLRELSERIENNDIDAYFHPTVLQDINGNTVGTVELEDEEE